MAGYVKLFGSILQSSIWGESSDVRVVWVTMLALADRDGIVEASVPGLAHEARVSRETCQAALDLFAAPDPDSKTPDNEGRRIEKCEGGWRLLNYELHQDRKSAADIRAKGAERAKRFRERNAPRNVTSRSVTPSNAPSRSVTVPVTSGSGSGSSHAQTEIRSDLAPAPPPPAPKTVFVACRDEFKRRWEKAYPTEVYPFVAKDGVQLAALLKANPQLAESWSGVLDRYLADPWWGEHGRHGLAALCTNVNKFSGPVRAAGRDVTKGWSPPAPASAFKSGEVDMRAIMREAEGQ